ncbi:MAG: hypothetical protein JXM73_13240 [Anaerolineae bacterium]|nr:hypothetical protein [Anaerolineae bacterium]
MPCYTPQPLPAQGRRTSLYVALGLFLLSVATLLFGVTYLRQEIQQQWRSRYDLLQAQYEELRQSHELLLAEHGILRDQKDTLQQGYELLMTEHNAVQQRHDLLLAEHNILIDQYTLLQDDHNRLLAEHNTLVDQYNQIRQDYDRLVADYNSLVDTYNRIQQDYTYLAANYNALLSQNALLQQDYDSLVADYNSLRDVAITPPYICAYGRRVYITFYKMDHTIDYWSIPFSSLEASIEQGVNNREGILSRLFSQVSLESPDTNQRLSVWDFRSFVDPAPFRDVMSELYYQSGGGDAFIREVWNIVTQLAVYSDEMQETPRYPLETFLAGGGDCEDTAILLASMIKAAPVSWKVALVYMNSAKPFVFSEVNHVIVYVNTGEHEYYIDTTSDSDMQPFGSWVAGWLPYIS